MATAPPAGGGDGVIFLLLVSAPATQVQIERSGEIDHIITNLQIPAQKMCTKIVNIYQSPKGDCT